MMRISMKNVAPFTILVLLMITSPSSSQGAGSGGDECSKNDILVAQGPGSSAGGSGEQSYTVEIVNRSPTGISISDIHLSCGGFSSTGFINPNIIKRLSFNDCIINGGQPLRAGLVVSFTYTSTVRYDLRVSSVQC